jgi:peptide/nickel transport system permease protein
MAVFLSVRFIPGNIIDLMVAQLGPTGNPDLVDRAALERAMGLDVPMPIAYLRWLGAFPQENGQFSGLVQGNLGKSLWSGDPVTKSLGERLPISLELGFIALGTALLTAIPIGVYSAMRQDTIADYAGRSISIVFISVPSFWLATMLMVYPSIWWSWSPPAEYFSITRNLATNLEQFLLAGFIMGMVVAGSLMRMTRTMMLEVLRQDYIRTAWAKGLREYTVVMRHALKNALIPVVTIIGMMFPILVGGTIIIEQIFGLPGMGLLMFQALNSRDYPVISGINVFVAAIVMFTNLIVDLAYAWLDPRVSYR